MPFLTISPTSPHKGKHYPELCIYYFPCLLKVVLLHACIAKQYFLVLSVFEVYVSAVTLYVFCELSQLLLCFN